MKRTRIPRRSPNYARKHRVNEAIKREKAKRRNGVPGKAGIVRLKGVELMALRYACFSRDGFSCVECGRKETLEMAHIHAKRNGGDTLENVRTLCARCHRLEHNGGKPVPKKSLASVSDVCIIDGYEEVSNISPRADVEAARKDAS